MQHTNRADRIVVELRNDILSGRYRPGERLPSERDLGQRFATTRGTIREAVKKLEQLGIAQVQPGGARVMPITEANLDVIGHLFDLHPLPDPELLYQTLSVLQVLASLAAKLSVEQASDEDLKRARNIMAKITAPAIGEIERFASCHELSRIFIETSGNLVLRLISNGLKSQVLARLKAAGVRPDIERETLLLIIRTLDVALIRRDSDSAQEGDGGS